MKAFPRPAIYLVTDRRQLTPDARTVNEELTALDGFLDEAIDAGVDAIQIREPDVAPGRLASFVQAVRSRASTGQTLVLVNDRADVALAGGADGVHLKADGPSVARIRMLSGQWVVGRSVHAGDAVAEIDDAEYLLFGTVFPSASKPQGSGVAGVEALRAVAAVSRAPVLAIGGVTPAGAAACRRAGAAGVAAISLFLPEGRAQGSLGVHRAVLALRDAFLSGD